jgi:hypothetical protein
MWLHMRFVSQITLSPEAVYFEGKETFFRNLLSTLDHFRHFSCKGIPQTVRITS